MQFSTESFYGARRLRPEEVRRAMIVALLAQPDHKADLDGHHRYQGMRRANRPEAEILRERIDRDNARLRNIAAGGKQRIPVPRGVGRNEVDEAVRAAAVAAAPDLGEDDLAPNDYGNLHVTLPTLPAFEAVVADVPGRLEVAARRAELQREHDARMAEMRGESVVERLARRAREARLNGQ
jgi:hypothetical protein